MKQNKAALRQAHCDFYFNLFDATGQNNRLTTVEISSRKCC
jgi:hypothetical protein